MVVRTLAQNVLVADEFASTVVVGNQTHTNEHILVCQFSKHDMCDVYAW